jgi:hypothetical protein
LNFDNKILNESINYKSDIINKNIFINNSKNNNIINDYSLISKSTCVNEISNKFN